MNPTTFLIIVMVWLILVIWLSWKCFHQSLYIIRDSIIHILAQKKKPPLDKEELEESVKKIVD